jgi:CheY-like chemotaxis protein
LFSPVSFVLLDHVSSSCAALDLRRQTGFLQAWREAGIRKRWVFAHVIGPFVRAMPQTDPHRFLTLGGGRQGVFGLTPMFIVTDISMPRLNGIEAAHKIRGQILK